MQDKYYIGDEIRLKTGPDSYLYAVVTHVDGDWIAALIENGRYTSFYINQGSWRRTGRNFEEVESLLHKIGATKNVKKAIKDMIQELEKAYKMLEG